MKREYYRAQYADEKVITLIIDKGNPITGMFEIRWVDLFGEFAPKLEAFNDSWEVLVEFQDLLERLPTMQAMNRDEFCKVLDELGIIEKK